MEDELEDLSKKMYEDGIANLEEEKELKMIWRKEINENPAIQKYFEDYSSFSIKSFIDSYLSTKYLAYKYKTFYGSQLEEIRTRWIDEATEHLEVILQKKLFDLQCLWRAEQITLDGIEIAFDFTVWKENIFNFPSIEITSGDIIMYQDFLLTGEVEIDEYEYYEWQEYDDFKRGDEYAVEMPDWYDFHNLRTGNSSLLLLPNIRGEKEEFYIDLYHKNKKIKEPEFYQIPDSKPFISTSDEETLRYFVTTFEDVENRKNILHYKKYTATTSDEYLQEVLMNMSEIDDIIPIESHNDYREAIILAYKKYRIKKIIEYLPLAFEQYLFNKKMQLSAENDKFYKMDLSIKSLFYNQILDGRELNGEPRDLNF